MLRRHHYQPPRTSTALNWQSIPKRRLQGGNDAHGADDAQSSELWVFTWEHGRGVENRDLNSASRGITAPRGVATAVVVQLTKGFPQSRSRTHHHLRTNAGTSRNRRPRTEGKRANLRGEKS
jgi:hypothetical protein